MSNITILVLDEDNNYVEALIKSMCLKNKYFTIEKMNRRKKLKSYFKEHNNYDLILINEELMDEDATKENGVNSLFNSNKIIKIKVPDFP